MPAFKTWARRDVIFLVHEGIFGLQQWMDFGHVMNLWHIGHINTF